MGAFTKLMTLMNFQDGYHVSARAQLFQKELAWVFLKLGKKPEDALFVSYAYKGSDYPAYFKEISDIFSKEGIKLIDIDSGDPASLIGTSNMIVTGGGDISAFFNKMNSLISPVFNPYTAIKNRIASAIPYIGWNEGSNVISPKYFTPNTGSLANGINVSPFEIVCNYLNNSQNKKSIFDFLKANPAINQLIAQTDQLKPDGTSVRLEETGAGMIDTPSDPYPIVIKFKIVGGVLTES